MSCVFAGLGVCLWLNAVTLFINICVISVFAYGFYGKEVGCCTHGCTGAI